MVQFFMGHPLLTLFYTKLQYFFRSTLILPEKEIKKLIMNSIDTLSKFELYWELMQRQFIRNLQQH